MLFQVIESIATSLRENDAGIESKLNNAQCEHAAMKTDDRVESSKISGEVKLDGETATDKESRSENLTSDQVLSCALICPDVKPLVEEVVEDSGKQSSAGDEWNQVKSPDCTECQIQRRDPSPEELRMCLHAAVYKVRLRSLTIPAKGFSITSVSI